MKSKRREFLKQSALTGIGLAGAGILKGFSAAPNSSTSSTTMSSLSDAADQGISQIGQYGPWATSLIEGKLPSHSYRNKQFTNLDEWRKKAKERLFDRLAIPDLGGLPSVQVKRQYTYDGLHVEELSWQLPYGPPTEAILLKPANATGKLPGILAFHDHGGNKYFGTRKITKTGDDQHPLMKDHQRDYYSGNAWANEIAKRGYVVLVADAFPFASRRVLLGDVPEHLRNGLDDHDPENAENIHKYNQWAAAHEHIMAKSLFCGGTTWPAVFFAEDKISLDILCARKDVDADHIGCAGLSGGGMRTVFMGGIDPRISCCVCVGFMTTWKDFLMYKSFTHTWMTYVPVLPNELDFPEILGLRAPLPTYVQNDHEDELYTVPEMKRAEGILSEVFKKAGAPDHFKCSYYPGPHKFDSDMQKDAFAWFDRWLKK